MRTQNIIIALACVLLAACGEGEDKATQQTKQKMMSLYGENKELAKVPEGQPSVVISSGVYVGRNDDGVKTFKGIPYALAPVGNLRWRTPQPLKPGSKIYEAYYFGKSAIQTEADSEPASYYPQSENCLTLNVWTTAEDSTPKKPVMVWIHGGSYGWGGTSDPMYDFHNFVKDHPEVVLVSANYRLGIMGFLDLTQFEGGKDYRESADLGLLDQVAALQWVHDNISKFGGDASQVTIFGESAGGGSVSLLTVMPKAKGLFHRVIVESGSVALTSNRENCKQLTDRVKKVTGAKSVSDLLKISESDMKKYNEQLNEYNCFPLRDGYILPSDPYKAYADGAAGDIDMMMGTNSDEVRYWINELGGMSSYKFLMPVWYENILAGLGDEERASIERFVDNRNDERIWNISEFFNELFFRGPMLRMADGHSNSGGKTFVYYWSYPSAIPNRGACHAVELAYVLDNPQDTIYTGNNVDLDLAKESQQMWVNFAVTGNPSTTAHVFPQYDSHKRQSLHLDKNIRIENDMKSAERKIFASLVPRYTSPLYCNLSYNVPTVWRYVAYAAVPLLIVIVGIIWLVARRRKQQKIKV